MNASATTHFTIGTLARRVDVAVDTIRYYEREGLLPDPRRRASGYREYDEQAVERVRFIRRAKDLGFTLDEIRELLSLESDREKGVEGVRRRAKERMAELERRIAQMTEMRNDLARLIDACPGSGDPECCPILSSLHGEQPVPAQVAVGAGSEPRGCGCASAARSISKGR